MRTAQLYMRVAAHVGDDPAKAQRVADLSLRELGKAISDTRPAKAPLSDADQAALHEMMAIWYRDKPEWREQWLDRLHREAEKQRVSPSKVVFPESGGGG